MRKISILIVILSWMMTGCVRAQPVASQIGEADTAASIPSNLQTSNDRCGPTVIDDIAVISEQVWVATEAASVWKTVDSGQTWKPVFSAIDRIQKILFVDHSEGFLLTGGAIFFTTDAGESWVERSKTPKGAFSFDFSDVNNGWLLAEEYPDEGGVLSVIFLTRDGGKNWVKIDSLPNSAKSLFKESFVAHGITSTNSGQVYVAGSGGVMESSDKGVTWKRVRVPEGLYESVSFSTPLVGCIVEKDISASMCTNNGGRTWENLSLPVVQNGSTFLVGENWAFILDSRGYIFRRSTKKTGWDRVVSANLAWRDAVAQDSIGQAVLVRAIDSTVVMIWFVNGRALTFVPSRENNKQSSIKRTGQNPDVSEENATDVGWAAKWASNYLVQQYDRAIALGNTPGVAMGAAVHAYNSGSLMWRDRKSVDHAKKQLQDANQLQSLELLNRGTYDGHYVTDVLNIYTACF